MSTLYYYFLFVYVTSGYSVSTTNYDQRQTGEFNVQVDLKDIQIIALLKNSKEEYVDYDYAYDYSEMTIKPQNRTTPKPLNSSSEQADVIRDNTTTTAASQFSEHTTAVTPNKTSEALNMTTIYDYITSTRHTVVTEDATEISVTPENRNITSSTGSTSVANCKKGFILNHKGECELRLQGTGNALLKLVKLSQKLKLRRENKSNPEDD